MWGSRRGAAAEAELQSGSGSGSGQQRSQGLGSSQGGGSSVQYKRERERAPLMAPSVGERQAKLAAGAGMLAAQVGHAAAGTQKEPLLGLRQVK